MKRDLQKLLFQSYLAAPSDDTTRAWVSAVLNDSEILRFNATVWAVILRKTSGRTVHINEAVGIFQRIQNKELLNRKKMGIEPYYASFAALGINEHPFVGQYNARNQFVYAPECQALIGATTMDDEPFPMTTLRLRQYFSWKAEKDRISDHLCDFTGYIFPVSLREAERLAGTDFPNSVLAKYNSGPERLIGFGKCADDIVSGKCRTPIQLKLFSDDPRQAGAGRDVVCRAGLAEGYGKSVGSSSSGFHCTG